MQKKFPIQFFISLMLLALFTAEVANAYNTTTTVIRLMKQPTPIDNPEDDTDSDGKRAPSRSILCVISDSTGIEIQNFDEEILSYEIWSNNESLLKSFTTENEFINYLFSHPGEYQIRLQSDSYILTGYIIIN